MRIKFNYIFLLSGLFFISGFKTSANKEILKNKNLSASAKIYDTTNFFNDCLKLMNNSYIGSLTGIVRGKDSINFLCFADCYDCKRSYEIVFVRKGGVLKRKSLGIDKISDDFYKGCNNDFVNFDCVAFVNPMRNPDMQKDPHAMNIDFPVTMNIYVRLENNTWQFIKSITVRTFEEYQTERFKAIYNIKQ
jgi:hypothetical protein